MEVTGRDGGRGPSWSYRRRHEKTGSTSSYTTSSSRSGTIVSSAYTSTSSCHSSSMCMEVALQQLDLEQEVGMSWIESDKMDAEFCIETKETLKVKRMKHIESLVQEFFGAPSANRINEYGDMNVLERWFSELGVSWVLQLDVGASPLLLGHPPVGESETWSWIPALVEIMETIHLTESFFADHAHGFVGMPGISEEEVESRKQSLVDPLQFARFFQKAMSKMLVFVDVMFSKNISIIRGPSDTSVSLVPFLHIHSALSEVLLGIRLQFHSSPPAEVEKIEKEMVSLLSAKQGKAFDAIWSTLEGKTRVLKSMEEYSSGTRTPQGSYSNIHEATCSLMDHIKFLLDNHLTLDPLVSQAASLGKYVPQTGLGEAPPFISLITEMVSSLEEKLIAKSQLFLDQDLRFLFLLNSLNNIRQQLICSDINVDVAAITRKVEQYTESYIQVSWAPMLACLSNHTPVCLGRNYSPLSKFESEFQKIYTTQMLWKVSQPELRKGLRKAVIEKIIPAYTKYIEDHKVKKSRFTPQDLEERLQELFEG